MAAERNREHWARGIGAAVALAAMGAAVAAIGWPAPGASIALGLVAWAVVRSAGQGGGDG